MILKLLILVIILIAIAVNLLWLLDDWNHKK